MNKMCICRREITPQDYAGFSDFDLVIYDYPAYIRVNNIHYADVVHGLKVVNPDIKVLMYVNLVLVGESHPYWSEINAHDEWFAKDNNGNRCYYEHTDPGGHVTRAYLMDVRNVEWQAAFITILADFSIMDGFFLDDVWNTLENKLNDFVVPPSDEYRAGFHDGIIVFLQYIKGQLGYRISLINTNSESYAPYCDGLFVELLWFSHISVLQAHERIVNMGKGFVAWHNVNENRDFDHAVFMLAMGANSFFGAGSYPDSYKSTLDTGSSTGSFYRVSENVYARPFENGVLTVDLTGKTWEFAGETPTRTVTISKQGEGSTVPAVGLHEYSDGFTLEVVAVPSSGWTFEEWLNVSPDNPYSFTVSSDVELTAVFTEEPVDPCEGVVCDSGFHCENGVCVLDENGDNHFLLPLLSICAIAGLVLLTSGRK